MPVSGVDTEKKYLREKFIGLRKSIPSEEKRTLDRVIAEKLFSLREYRDSRLVLVYVSKGIEVSTELIIERALSGGKAVAVPKCNAETLSMSFYRINSRDELSEGYCGILEPDTAECGLVTDYSGSLCVVPALSYDSDGYRLGFGKGFYDRFLSRFNGVSVGLCYKSCLSETLPKDGYDRRVDIVLTD